jgi:hypothetical protein
MSETPDFWEGFDAAIILENQELDKLLTVAYNDSRIKDCLLDLKCFITSLREMMPNEYQNLHLQHDGTVETPTA